MMSDEASLLDAMHLASASLPIGGFAYSQGLEQACQAGIVTDVLSANHWISDYLRLVIARQEMPWWLAIYNGCRGGDWLAVQSSIKALVALRETAELRLEARQMGHAMVRLYDQWGVTNTDLEVGDIRPVPQEIKAALQADYTAAHAVLCGLRMMPARVAMAAWLWSWMDNQVLAAVKLVPLGQQDGQLLLHRLKPKMTEALDTAFNTPLDRAGSAPLGLVLASTRHETQYARLFRS